jgi:glycosyltransferase involved in cell wall biosynthesis
MNTSIVIPVYNESKQLDACLASIAGQSVAPFEVIVVDNNSTDDSALVAERYPFVRLLREYRQGVVHARNRGFNSARGDIIGRIDADSILPPDWVEHVSRFFVEHPAISAVSGSAHYYDFAFTRLIDSVDYYLRQRLAMKLGQENFLWGANMAIRRQAWRAIRRGLCQHQAMHEDLDLAIHLQARGHIVDYEPQIVAGVSCRRIDMRFQDYVRYCLVSPRTYAMHRLRSRRHMYPIIMLCWAVYLPARVIYRGYDPVTGSFSVNRAFFQTTPRVDPTTNIV